MAISWAK